MNNYKLVETNKTPGFYAEIVIQARRYIQNGFPEAKALARALYQKAGLGGYFWRSVFPGEHAIEKIISHGPNCYDYSVVAKNILKKHFNRDSSIKQAPLVLIKNHQYLLTDKKEVLDMIIGLAEFPDGYFKNEQIYQQELAKINQQKNKIFLKQIKAILFPKQRKKLC